MPKFTALTVEDLKADCHYFTAGALAYELGLTDNYGCHYGMRSTRDDARAAFKAGYAAARNA